MIGADAIKAGMLMNALQLRGYDQFFMDLVLDVALAEKVMDRILGTLKEMWTHYMEAVGPYVQVAYVTDDFGTQKSMMVSPKMFRDLIKPRWKELIEHIKSLGDVKVMFHSDGAILPLLDDFVDMGVDILNPVQTSVSRAGGHFCAEGEIRRPAVLSRRHRRAADDAQRNAGRTRSRNRPPHLRPRPQWRLHPRALPQYRP